MNDIVAGRMTVDEARSAYAEKIASYATGRPTPYCEAFQFELPQGGTEDLDEVVMRAGTMARQRRERPRRRSSAAMRKRRRRAEGARVASVA